jgi:hypothetical protein
MNARTRREALAWGKAVGFVALLVAVLAALVALGLSTIN